MRASRKKDISNQKYNRLTAISFSNLDSRGMTHWLFRCDCGKEVVRQKARVLRGKTSSCGCARIKKDIITMKFNRLTAIKPVESVKRYEYKWLFKCDCGNEKIILKSSVLSNRVVSCGCYGKERRAITAKISRTKHGKVGSKVYYTWVSMKERCLNSRQGMFPRYGGRGIKVCDRWLNSFENFLIDMGEPPTSKHSIDRINNDGNYEPDNCKWATNKEQSRNKSVTKFATYQGVTKSLLDWCDELNLSYQLMRGRLLTGWKVERAFTTPKVKSSFSHEKGIVKFGKQNVRDSIVDFYNQCHNR